MNWIEKQIRSWQAIIDHLNRTGGSQHYLGRAYNTRNAYLRKLSLR